MQPTSHGEFQVNLDLDCKPKSSKKASGTETQNDEQMTKTCSSNSHSCQNDPETNQSISTLLPKTVLSETENDSNVNTTSTNQSGTLLTSSVASCDNGKDPNTTTQDQNRCELGVSIKQEPRRPGQTDIMTKTRTSESYSYAHSLQFQETHSFVFPSLNGTGKETLDHAVSDSTTASVTENVSQPIPSKSSKVASGTETQNDEHMTKTCSSNSHSCQNDPETNQTISTLLPKTVLSETENDSNLNTTSTNKSGTSLTSPVASCDNGKDPNKTNQDQSRCKLGVSFKQEPRSPGQTDVMTNTRTSESYSYAQSLQFQETHSFVFPSLNRTGKETLDHAVSDSIIASVTENVSQPLPSKTLLPVQNFRDPRLQRLPLSDHTDPNHIEDHNQTGSGNTVNVLSCKQERNSVNDIEVHTHMLYTSMHDEQRSPSFHQSVADSSEMQPLDLTNNASKNMHKISVPISVPTSVPTSVPISVPTSVPISVPISVPTSVPISVPMQHAKQITKEVNAATSFAESHKHNNDTSSVLQSSTKMNSNVQQSSPNTNNNCIATSRKTENSAVFQKTYLPQNSLKDVQQMNQQECKSAIVQTLHELSKVLQVINNQQRMAQIKKVERADEKDRTTTIHEQSSEDNKYSGRTVLLEKSTHTESIKGEQTNETSTRSSSVSLALSNIRRRSRNIWQIEPVNDNRRSETEMPVVFDIADWPGDNETELFGIPLTQYCPKKKHTTTEKTFTDTSPSDIQTQRWNDMADDTQSTVNTKADGNDGLKEKGPSTTFTEFGIDDNVLQEENLSNQKESNTVQSSSKEERVISKSFCRISSQERVEANTLDDANQERYRNGNINRIGSRETKRNNEIFSERTAVHDDSAQEKGIQKEQTKRMADTTRARIRNTQEPCIFSFDEVQKMKTAQYRKFKLGLTRKKFVDFDEQRRRIMFSGSNGHIIQGHGGIDVSSSKHNIDTVSMKEENCDTDAELENERKFQQSKKKVTRQNRKNRSKGTGPVSAPDDRTNSRFNFRTGGTGYFSWRNKYQSKPSNQPPDGYYVTKTGSLQTPEEFAHWSRFKEREQIRKQIETALREYKETFEGTPGTRRSDEKVASYLKSLTDRLNFSDNSNATNHRQMETQVSSHGRYHTQSKQSKEQSTPDGRSKVKHKVSTSTDTNVESVFSKSKPSIETKTNTASQDDIKNMLSSTMANIIKETIESKFAHLSDTLKEQILREMNQNENNPMHRERSANAEKDRNQTVSSESDGSSRNGSGNTQVRKQHLATDSDEAIGVAPHRKYSDGDNHHSRTMPASDRSRFRPYCDHERGQSSESNRRSVERDSQSAAGIDLGKKRESLSSISDFGDDWDEWCGSDTVNIPSATGRATSSERDLDEYRRSQSPKHHDDMKAYRTDEYSDTEPNRYRRLNQSRESRQSHHHYFDQHDYFDSPCCSRHEKTSRSLKNDKSRNYDERFNDVQKISRYEQSYPPARGNGFHTCRRIPYENNYDAQAWTNSQQVRPFSKTRDARERLCQIRQKYMRFRDSRKNNDYNDGDDDDVHNFSHRTFVADRDNVFSDGDDSCYCSHNRWHSPNNIRKRRIEYYNYNPKDGASSLTANEDDYYRHSGPKRCKLNYTDREDTGEWIHSNRERETRDEGRYSDGDESRRHYKQELSGNRLGGVAHTNRVIHVGKRNTSRTVRLPRRYDRVQVKVEFGDDHTSGDCSGNDEVSSTSRDIDARKDQNKKPATSFLKRKLNKDSHTREKSETVTSSRISPSLSRSPEEPKCTETESRPGDSKQPATTETLGPFMPIPTITTRSGNNIPSEDAKPIPTISSRR